MFRISSSEPDSSPIFIIEDNILGKILFSLIGPLKPSPLTTLSLIFKIASSATLFSNTPATVGKACTKDTPDASKVDNVLVNLETIIFLFKAPIMGSFNFNLLIFTIPFVLFL